MNTKLLKQKILDLAIRGKLTQQLKSDGTAADLLTQISDERRKTRDERKGTRSKKSGVILSEAQSAKSKDLGQIIPLDKSEAPFEIPANWEWVRLGDFCELISGQDFPPEKYNAEKKGLPYITGASNFVNNHVILNRWTEYPSVIAQKGDILLVCKGSGYGNYVYADFEKAHIARQIMAIRISDKTLNAYVYNFLGSQYERLKFQGNGLVPGIARSVVLDLTVPLPPLAEQQRIVEKIQEAFAEIDSIKNNKELLKTHIKQTRQKILDLAIHGKLVPQDENDEPASVLLERITRDNPHYEKMGLDERRETKDERDSNYKRHSREGGNLPPMLSKDEVPFEVPENWCWCRLGDICNKLIDGDHNPPKGLDYVTKYMMLSSRNINDNDIVDLENVRYLSKEMFEEENQRTKLEEGDILFTSVGSLGRSCIFSGDGKYCFQRSVSLIHTNIYNEYLKYFFDSNYYQKYIVENATGTAQMGFYLEQMRKSFIAIPPFAEQSRIVAKIEELFSTLDQMERNLV